MTLREKYTQYLTEHGWQRDYSTPQSRKYHKYNHPHKPGWYFLGKAGSIRFNFENRVTGSQSMVYFERRMLQQWEKDNGHID